MNLTITYRDTATRAIENLPALISSPAVIAKGGEALKNSVIRNFGKLGPNKRFPGASTGFWGNAALSTVGPSVAGTTAMVSVTQIGVRQRFLGGRIAPPFKNGSQTKYLTIPAQEDAYGKRARLFDDLSVAFLGRSITGLPVLALVRGNPRTTGKKDVMFWLVKGVTQDADPSVLPTEDQLRTAFASGVRSYVNSQLNRNAIKLEDFQ